METHLTLKHIVGYLPYGLKILYFVNGGNCLINDTYELNTKNIHRCLTFAKYTEKPILRPLSDLTKEIEVNGEKFVPINWFDENIFPKHNSPAVCFTDGYVEMCYFKEYEKLYEWHFDIHGLIEKGLAIDINTIDNGIQ